MTKRITTQELHYKIEQLETSNDLQHGHLSSRVDELKESVKDNRDYFTNALQSLDKKAHQITQTDKYYM